jgi:hypothetical protein
MQLRPYQQKAVSRTLKCWTQYDRLLGVAATGAGKTIIAAAIIQARLSEGPALFIAHREELLSQAVDKLKRASGIVATREQANDRASLADAVVVASVQSLHTTRLERWPPAHFKTIIVDECFSAGTLVDGRPIESLQVGQSVRSYNHCLGAIEDRKILHIFRSKPKSLVRIRFSDQRVIVCTPNHPFYIGGSCYLPTSKLRRGQIVYGENRDPSILVAVGVENIEVLEPGLCPDCPDGLVYNLEVEGNNNYFANGLLVHNCHRSASTTYRRVIEHFSSAKVLGITATPDRSDQRSLGEIFEEIAFEIGLPELIEQGYLAPIRVETLPLKIDLAGVGLDSRGDLPARG